MSIIHSQPFDGAGKTYALNAKGIDGDQIRVEDYWDRVSGELWGTSRWNPAALNYAVRAAVIALPSDDDVVYGKVGGLGYLVHVSELGEVES